MILSLLSRKWVAKESGGVRWSPQWSRRKTLRAGVAREGLRAGSGLRRLSEAFLLWVQQVGDVHEVVGKDGGADQDLKAVTALGQTSLHAAAAKQHGDTALNACPEALSFLELRALFKRFSLRGSFSTPLRNADELDIRARFDVLNAEKASVRTVPSGSQTESLLMTLQ